MNVLGVRVGTLNGILADLSPYPHILKEFCVKMEGQLSTVMIVKD